MLTIVDHELLRDLFANAIADLHLLQSNLTARKTSLDSQGFGDKGAECQVRAKIAQEEKRALMALYLKLCEL